MHIGYGYDVHCLVAGRPLFLGGLEIKHPKGLEGHSDGDVLTHALIDAMLGAAGLADIGEQFPNTDEQFRGISSMVLLEKTMRLVSEAGYGIVNVDVTVVAEEPKLGLLKKNIQARLAGVMGVEEKCVSIKAKTAEKLGPVGRGEAIEAHAAALLEEK